MRIAFLADLGSIHTVRWVNVFAEHGHEVHVVSINKAQEPIHPDVMIHLLPFKAPAGYYLNAFSLKKILKKIKPDILNAHYASGYGTLARLSGFHPLVLSVWGSDVYDFPYRSAMKMRIVQKNLDAADVICSTSHAMAEQTKKILRHEKIIHVTPFGIDTNVFTPKEKCSEKARVIGTVKTMSRKYGVDILIGAFAEVCRATGDPELQLMLAGDGDQTEELRQLAKVLNIADRVVFMGRIPHEKVPEVLHSFDIYAALSRQESFGVAVLEASACGLPVVVSDAGGLPEVVEDGVTGVVVPKENIQAAADAFEALLTDMSARRRMCECGVAHVEQNYAWIECYKKLACVFEHTLGL